MAKIAHIADTHIRNLKYHYEYKIIFAQMYETLKNEKVDYIVHCGDIAHTKTQISPEFVQMASEFFYNLAQIAPTYIILGNHDGNLKNSSRQDAITPIINALDHPNLHLLKDSGETEIGSNICLNVLSVFDEDNWTPPSDDSKINIALYHGAIWASKTDTGFSLQHGDHDINIFNDFDYAMLGDIHQRQFLDEEQTIWYPGSTVQQNFGESNDKGILIWDIKDKVNKTIKPVVFDNPRPFISWNIQLDHAGNIDTSDFSPPDGARLRLIADSSLSIDVVRKATEIVKHKYSPESVTFLNRVAERNGIDVEASDVGKLDLRDIGTQEDLIEEYLEPFNLSQDELDNVLRLNKKYNDVVNREEDVSRNVNWRLESIQWDNLFNYGTGNQIDFNNLSGIVGIFGKNFSGKSSVIDSILYGMFNSTSKNEKKNLNVINQNRDKGFAKLDISVGEHTYTIERDSEKYQKRLKGVETTEAKTNVSFFRQSAATDEIEPLNGLTRNDTDRIIRNHFGTLEDFLLTSMSSQNGALNFISEGATRRKEIFAKFLDLNQFETKFKLAKEDSAEVRAVLKKLEGRNFKEEIKEQVIELAKVTKKLNGHEEDCISLSRQIDQIAHSISEVDNKINSIPAEIIDIAKVRKNIVTKNTQLDSIDDDLEQLRTERTQNSALYEKLCAFVDGFNIADLREKKKEIDLTKERIATHKEALESSRKEHKNYASKVELLHDHEYDPDCKYCCENKFVKDAELAREKIPSIQAKITEITNGISLLEGIYADLYPERVLDHIDKYQKVLDKKVATSSRCTEIGLLIERNESKHKLLTKEIADLRSKEELYEKNKEAIENLEALTSEKELLEKSLNSVRRSLAKCEKDKLQFYKQTGSLEEKISSLEEQQSQLEVYRNEFSAYDLYMQCMHSNGIAFDIIKKKLPVINDEIAKTISNIVDFEVFFEVEGSKFEIYIKHPRHDARPLEMGSGAEKTVAAMAIRMALLTVSSMPKGDIFILDEPGTALDEENMEGFIRMLELIKVNFKTVLLISHLDSLKDCVDMQIVIDKKEGYAHIRQ